MRNPAFLLNRPNPRRGFPMPIKKGLPAPSFSLKDDEGKTRSLSDFKGIKIVLYFYPKDDTPGCTTEACNFRDDYSAYVDAGITILGVSPDSVNSHRKFREKYHLPFSLLADEDHKIADAYGVWGQKKFMGKDYMGVLRTTFIVDESGRIAHVFEDIKPADHSKEILSLL
jgi:thioredoxin-dependent peroxiredoxin